jgi:tetratricopeptide (TPR) repeat protein
MRNSLLISLLSFFILCGSNSYLRVTAQSKPNKPSTNNASICRDEIQRSNQDKLDFLSVSVVSNLEAGKTQQVAAQLTQMAQIALNSNSDAGVESLVSRVILNGEAYEFESTVVGRLIKQGQSQDREALVAMLDKMLQLTQKINPNYSLNKTQAFIRIAQAYQKLGFTERPGNILALAIESAKGVRGFELQANTYTDIAKAYLAIKQPKQAESLLNKALEFAKKHAAEDKKGDTSEASSLANSSFRPFFPIAELYSQLGKFERTLELTKLTTTDEAKDGIYLILTQYHLKAKQLDKAAEYTQKITTENIKRQALVELMEAYAKGKQATAGNKLFAQVVELARNSKTQPDFALQSVISSYAKVGQPETASTAIQYISNSVLKKSSLLTIAGEYRKLGQTEKVKQTIEQIIKEAEGTQGSDISQWIATSDYSQESFTILKQLKIQNPDVYQYIVEDAIRSENLDLALEVAEAIEAGESDRRNSLLLKVAVAYASAKQPQTALKVVKNIKNEGNLAYQVDALVKIASVLRKNGLTKQAVSTYNTAKEEVKAIKDSQYKAISLAILAREENFQGQTKLANQLIQDAIKTAEGNGGVLQQISNLLIIAQQPELALPVNLALSQDGSLANQFSDIFRLSIQQGKDNIALEMVKITDLPQEKTSGLLQIARGQLNRQQKSKAIETLGDALKLAKTIPDPESKTIELPIDNDGVPRGTVDDTLDRASLFEDIAIVYSQAGQANQGLQVAKLIQNKEEKQRVSQRVKCY